MSGISGIANYIFEAGMLKRVKRSGWWAEQIKNPESVAEHSWRASVLAFILANLEGFDDESANRLCTAAAFHDMHETRLLDLNKITARYLSVGDSIEKKVERDQVQGMNANLKDSLLGVMRLSDDERIILKDADYLECAFQAKEYLGDEGAKIWLDNITERIRTKSAKSLMADLRKTNPSEWFSGLKKLE
jgi:putative hydrolase of HD superfamily